MRTWMIPAVGIAIALASPGAARADYRVQCPKKSATTRCFTLGAGDGFVKGADGSDIYMFGFADLSGIPAKASPEAMPLASLGFKPGAAIMDPAMYMMDGDMKASFPAPTLVMREGEDVYISLSNVGMHIRPDLFDAHTVHFHGFPNAAPVFDGVPESSFGTNMGASFTYYYHPLDPGTYMWHCHQEASEHLQMGMIGQLIVLPKQDGQDKEFPVGSGRHFTRFAYDDGDGSTGYDVAYPIQMASFDPKFHALEEDVQPPDFADMKDTMAFLNGRGYPDTINTAALVNQNGDATQILHTKIQAKKGQRVLLRVSSLSTTRFFTLTALGLPMQVVAIDARRLIGPGGAPAYYNSGSITLGGGQSADVLVDTAGIDAGTYFLYSTNLGTLSNDGQDFGGMMTEFLVTN